MLDFVGIGAQKAGTTWLYAMLSLHPGLRFPAGKEVHYWDAQLARGLPWYHSLFPTTPGQLNGEITPAYAILPTLTIAQVKQAFPELRLFYIMRNPIHRAWSSALMALGRAEMTLPEASDEWFIDHFLSAGSLARGNYAACLQNWWQFFAKEQLLVLFYEQIQDDPEGLLVSCLDHLGLNHEDYFESIRPQIDTRVFAGLGHTIRPSLLPALREIYHPVVENLSMVLNKDMSHWKT